MLQRVASARRLTYQDFWHDPDTIQTRFGQALPHVETMTRTPGMIEC
jgi:hypothetical protein